MSVNSFLSKDKDLKYCELRDVCKICVGISFKSGSYRDKGFPLVKVRNIQDGQITLNNLNYCNPDDYPHSEVIRYGDVVMAKDASCGKVGINLTDKEFLFDSHVVKFVPDEKFLTRRYLYHFLLNKQDEIKEMARGSALLGIRKSELERFRIPVPSLEVQEKISSTLDKFREIEREINLRDKQYEYYRNYLITGSRSSQ
ncbi:type I restriction enzyme specificity HsdS domain protein [Mycoplasma haemocanis str. Illinois]|uniref:Type I restriction enzyme specificity HsdS domain protein n=1 Tax=Mycoplasma haemocanis (strain Illinois) TaxID=1111676 RepID=H6N6Y1_MYCHN|nr:restriction endonuclease subunit S [Mycoplasma haemocanis]AEW45403.1 type I restriction enzyme specificity HsdS domain protein [Mycoplasma haemocanis str. Illinois]